MVQNHVMSTAKENTKKSKIQTSNLSKINDGVGLKQMIYDPLFKSVEKLAKKKKKTLTQIFKKGSYLTVRESYNNKDICICGEWSNYRENISIRTHRYSDKI